MQNLKGKTAIVTGLPAESGARSQSSSGNSEPKWQSIIQAVPKKRNPLSERSYKTAVKLLPFRLT